MLKKESWQEIAKRTGIEADELQKLIASEKEEKVDFKNVTLFDDEELESLKSNIKKESYSEAKKAGEEMRMKELKDITGLEIEGYKDPKKFIEAYKARILSDAKIEPEKKVKEMEEKYNTLSDTYTKEKEAFENQLNQYQSKINDIEKNTFILTSLPEKLPSGITKEEAILIAKHNVKIDKTEDGKWVVYDDDKIKVDKLGNPVAANDTLKEFFIQKGWTSQEGRGGENSSGDGGFNDLNAAFEYMEKNGIDPDSPEGLKIQEGINK